MTGINPRHRRDHLSLLPSGPDEVHGLLLRGDRSELSARLDQPGEHTIYVVFNLNSRVNIDLNILIIFEFEQKQVLS